MILKGINRGGGDYLPNGVTSANLLSPAEVDAMNSVWHADYVRLFVSADLVNKAFTGTGCVGETGAYDPQYKNKVVAAVNEAEADHMLISLTIGRTNPNCYWNSALVASEWCPLQNPPCSNGWTGGLPLPMPGQDVATALSALSQYFSNTSLYPLVAFELYNEPHVCVTSTGLQGSGSGSCSQGESADADA